MKRIQSTLSLVINRKLEGMSAGRKARLAVLGLATIVCGLFIVIPTAFLATGNIQKGTAGGVQAGGGKATGVTPSFSQAVTMIETPALRDIAPTALTPEEAAKVKEEREEREKNIENSERVKNVLPGKTANFTDPAINNFKHPAGGQTPNVVTNPIQNFDGPDADTGA